MKKEKLDLIYQALFHSLGRVVSRSHGQPDDIDFGKTWLKEQLSHLNFGGDSRTEKIIEIVKTGECPLKRSISKSKRLSRTFFKI